MLPLPESVLDFFVSSAKKIEGQHTLSAENPFTIERPSIVYSAVGRKKASAPFHSQGWRRKRVVDRPATCKRWRLICINKERERFNQEETMTGKTWMKAALAMAVCVAAGATGANAADKPGFVSGGKFAVCTDASFPPMEYFEKSGDKDPVGFDVDLMHELAKAWGVSLEILPMDFAGLLPSLEAKRCDAVIRGIFVTDERKQKFDAIAYLDTVSVLAAKSGTEHVDSLEKLAGQTIAVQTGTSFVETLEKANKEIVAKGAEPLKLQLYPKASDAIQQVLIGRALGATTQDTELAFRDLQMPGALTSLYEFPDLQSFGIFVRKEDGDGAAVLATMTALKADGSLAKLAEKWRFRPEKLSIK
jgi:polar amino acid transport system substrate-binding protein